MNYLVDTCVLLWLTGNPSKLPASVRRIFGQSGGVIHVSAISAFELGIKVAKGKLQLPLAVGDWFVEVCQHHQLIEIPVSGLIFARATELEPVHNDPADRILIATALQHSLTLVTPDHVISSYANLQTLW